MASHPQQPQGTPIKALAVRIVLGFLFVALIASVGQWIGLAVSWSYMGVAVGNVIGACLGIVLLAVFFIARPIDRDRSIGLGVILPALLLGGLWAAQQYGYYLFVSSSLESAQTTDTVERHFVLRRMTESVHLFEPIPGWLIAHLFLWPAVGVLWFGLPIAGLLSWFHFRNRALPGGLAALLVVALLLHGGLIAGGLILLLMWEYVRGRSVPPLRAVWTAWAVCGLGALAGIGLLLVLAKLAQEPAWQANGKAFWLATLFIIPALSALLLVRRRLVGTPITIPAVVIQAVLCVPFVVAVLLALRTPGRVPFLEVDAPFYWTPILVAVLLVGLVYVLWMYIRDSRAVGEMWALFLVHLRLAVYTLLAGVFLLPALQSWEKSEQYSRVLLLLDVSGSMGLIDEVFEEGKPTPPTRLDQVHAFLTADQSAFLRRLQEKNPVVVYAFGGRLDEDFKEFKKDTAPWSPAEWSAWFKLDLKRWVLDGLSEEGKKILQESPDFAPQLPGTPEWATEWLRTGSIPEKLNPLDKELLKEKREKLPRKIEVRQQVLTSTNYGDSILTGLTRESPNMLAGMIVLGDGQSNQGSPSTFDELRRRATNMKVPIFTVGVGEYRELVNIRITELQAPEQVPPDDAFTIRVGADGEGLADKDFTVTLDIYKPGEPKTPAHQMTAKGKFSKAAGQPHGTVEFKIDPADKELAPLTVTVGSQTELMEGEWKFVARIPKAKGEPEPKKEHISDGSVVQVIKKPLRVLLFAGGPTREYQFTRRLFVNEVDKKRAELSIFLQVTDPKGPRVQDVPQERLLKSFPTFLRVDDDPTEKIEDRYYNLAQYDLIIAFDPDWTQVPREQLDLLQKWVQEQAGGLIVVAGPIHTFQLARGGNLDKLKPVVELLPVRVEDSRLQGLGVERQTTKPWRLNFPGVTAEMEFLRLDDEHKGPDGKPDPLAGWEEFFTGREKGAAPLPPGEAPLRGMFSYYPVKTVKPVASVIATFSDPAARYTKEDNTTAEQPYLVTMPFGKGRTIYLSSGEMWRLRLYKELFHERLWTKVGRYAAAGTQTKQSWRGRINAPQRTTVGNYVRVNVALKGPDLSPLPRNTEPILRIIPPGGAQQPNVKLKPAPRPDGSWTGEFEGQFQVTSPGEFQLEVPVPGSSEIIKAKTLVKEENREIDRNRPDFGLLRNKIASTVADLRTTEAAKKALREQLRGVTIKVEGDSAPQAERGKGAASRDDKDEPPLFFDLRSAQSIPDYLTQDRKMQKNRGPVEDLWDDGFMLTTDRLIWWLGWAIWVLAALTVVLAMLALMWDMDLKTRLLGVPLAAAAVGTLGFIFVLTVGIVTRNLRTPLTSAEFVGAMLATVAGAGVLIFMLSQKKALELFLPLLVSVVLMLICAITFAVLARWWRGTSLELGIVSAILVVVVALLSIEWLTRKLLKLA